MTTTITDEETGKKWGFGEAGESPDTEQRITLGPNLDCQTAKPGPYPGQFQAATRSILAAHDVRCGQHAYPHRHWPGGG